MTTKRINAMYYWDTMLRKALKHTGYLPKEETCLVTTSDELAELITPDIMRKWYSNDENLKIMLDDLYYGRRINRKYFSQSPCDVSDLEDIIKETYEFDSIRYCTDRTADLIYFE